MSGHIRWPETLRHHAAHPDPISLHCAIPARMIEEVADAFDTLTAELAAARQEFAEWLDAFGKGLEAHAEVVDERERLAADLAERLLATREQREHWAKFAFEMRRERDAAQELLAMHNLGGHTDYNDGPMRRALATEADRERLAAMVERVRGCERVAFYSSYAGHVVECETGDSNADMDAYFRAADILAALESPNV
jgi:hypothetical protein